MATANANAAPGATRPVDQHVEFVVKVGLGGGGAGTRGRTDEMYSSICPCLFVFLLRRLSQLVK